MDWIKECDVDLSMVGSEEETEFVIERVLDLDKIKKRYSILTEFYISISAKSPDAIISIFLKESRVPTELLETVIAHFKEVKLIKENNNPVEIMLQYANEDSINYIKNQPGNAIVRNLFNPNSEVNTSDEWLPKKTYKIESEKVNKYDDEEFDKVLPYLTPSKNEPYYLLTINEDWVLNDSLKNALAIKFFAHKFKEVYLWVDTNQRVTNIQLSLR